MHSLDGVLVIDKPAGPTSHDVVARARRALREKRIGHTGTLDPMATGVLPLVIGRATRLASLLSSTDKTYEAAVRLGSATDTYDAADRLAFGGAPPDAPAIDPEEIETALARFRGTFPQMPPPFSAKKVGGVPAYKLARKQQPTALTAVQVTVRELTLLAVDNGLVRLRVTGTAGFYVRSLAHDLGLALGCGAHLERLRRTRAGTFGLDRAVLLEDLDRRPDEVLARLIPMTDLLPDLPAARLTARAAQRASHGNSVSPEDFVVMGTGPVVRLLDPGGSLLGIAEAGPDGLLRPTIVLV
jgi:tRNA pseudouridine55 synthase